MKRIFPINTYTSGKVTKAKQDGNREFITLLACINTGVCTDITVPPLLVYKGKSGDLYDSWIQDLNPTDTVRFAVTENRWSNQDLGLK